MWRNGRTPYSRIPEKIGGKQMSQELRDELGNYHIGGKKYKSITTILKEEMPHMALDAWKERTPNWPSIGKKAAIYGTFMHMKIQELVTGTHQEVPKNFKLSEWCDMEMAQELDDRVEQWLNLGLNIGTPNITEHTVVVERHDEDGIVMAAGTLDYFGLKFSNFTGQFFFLDHSSQSNAFMHSLIAILIDFLFRIVSNLIFQIAW